jgi:hypothetical protein
VTRKTSVLFLGVALGACGRGGPTTPVAPAPTPTPAPRFEVLDGVTDAPLLPQSVSPPDPVPDQTVTVLLDGYLPREQTWRGPSVQLWPLDDQASPAQTLAELVHGGADETPLTRWQTGNFPVRFAEPDSPRLAQKGERIREFLGTVFGEIARAGGPEFTWEDAGSDDLKVPNASELTIIVNPKDECLQEGGYAACTRWWWGSQWTIKRAEIAFDSAQSALDPRLAKHMIGHALGLHDVNRAFMMMYTKWAFRETWFSKVELDAIHMMYQHRTPGDQPPDREAAVGAAGGGGEGEAGDPGPGG